MTITSISNRLKQVLSAKQTGILIILSGVIGRLIQILYFFNIRVDASYQTIATKNFVGGHGVTVDFVLPSDLSTIIYEPLIKWPPGFTLLLSPFYLLSGGNYIIAGILLHSICAVALIFFTRAFLRLFDLPLFFINIHTLVVSFFIYSFYFIISSDAIATSFFVAGLYYIFSLVKTERRSTQKIILASFCFLVCGLTKYLLIPVVFVIPSFLITKGFFTSNKAIKKAGFILFSILFVGLGVLLLYQKFTSGSAAYISEPERGFFPQNLLDAFPVLPAAFLNPDTLNLLSNTASAHNFIFRLYQLIYLLAITALVIELISFFKTLSEKISLRKTFFFLFLFISLALIGQLAILSIFIAKGEETPGRLWTYIQEPRYYGLLVVLLQLLLFIFYPVERQQRIKGLILFLFLMLAIEAVRGIVFDLNRMRLFTKEEYSWKYEDRFQKYADSIIKNDQKKFSIHNAVVTGSSYVMNNRICLYSHVPVLRNADIVNRSLALQAKKPVLLLVAIRKKDLPIFQSFISSQKEIAGKFDDFYFYTVYVQPH